MDGDHGDHQVNSSDTLGGAESSGAGLLDPSDLPSASGRDQVPENTSNLSILVRFCQKKAISSQRKVDEDLPNRCEGRHQRKKQYIPQYSN